MCPQMSEVAKSTKTVAGCGVSLGIYAKSITPPHLGGVARAAIQKNRADRYELLSVARRVFSAAGKRAGLVYGHDYCKTAKCRYISHGQGVGVHKSNLHKSAFIPAWSPAAGSGIALCAGQRSKNGGARRSPQLSNGPTTKACSLSWSR